MYIVERDQAVTVKNVSITAKPAETAGSSVLFSGVFDGTTYDADTNTFQYPSSAADWAGFANETNDVYPLTFSEAGKVTFNASVPSGGDVVVRFRLEANPYPNTEPSYNTATVTVSGSEVKAYEVAIPAQGAQTFNSFLMYLDTRDVDVVITDTAVVADAKDDEASSPSGGGTMVMNEAFGNATIDGNTYTFPTGAETWAGFSHDPLQTEGFYPIIVPNGATVVANMYGASSDVNVYFKFEKAAYPNTEPSYTGDTITVAAGSSATEYTMTVPATENTYSNFLMYIVERDTPLVLESVVITPTAD